MLGQLQVAASGNKHGSFVAHVKINALQQNVRIGAGNHCGFELHSMVEAMLKDKLCSDDLGNVLAVCLQTCEVLNGFLVIHDWVSLVSLQQHTHK